MSDEARRPVGITKGPGETIHEYTFISRDEQRLLKNGEYLYYELDDGAPSPSAPTAGARRRSPPGGLQGEPRRPPPPAASLTGAPPGESPPPQAPPTPPGSPEAAPAGDNGRGAARRPRYTARARVYLH